MNGRRAGQSAASAAGQELNNVTVNACVSVGVGLSLAGVNQDAISESLTLNRTVERTEGYSLPHIGALCVVLWALGAPDFFLSTLSTCPPSPMW